MTQRTNTAMLPPSHLVSLSSTFPQIPSTNSSSTPQFRYPFQRLYLPPPSPRHHSRPSRPRSDLIPFIPTRDIITVPSPLVESSRFDDFVLRSHIAFVPSITMYGILETVPTWHLMGALNRKVMCSLFVLRFLQ